MINRETILLGILGFLWHGVLLADCFSHKVYFGKQYEGCEITIDDLDRFEIDASKLPPFGCDEYCENHYVSDKQAIAMIRKASNAIAKTALTPKTPPCDNSESSDDSENSPKLLGSGLYGKIFGNSEKVIKVPSVLLQLRDIDLICESYEREVQLKERVLSALGKLDGSDLHLSPLIMVDPGRYAEEDLGPRHPPGENRAVPPEHRIKSCWMLMRKVNLNSATSSKGKNRQALYSGDLTPEKRELIKAVAQLFAVHIIGAGLDIPSDLELGVGTIKNKQTEKPVVTLLDYGLVHPLRNTSFISDDPHRSPPIVQCLDSMRHSIPDPAAGNKFAIFKESFLEVAETFHQRELAQKMLTYLENPSSRDAIATEEREQARARVSTLSASRPLSAPPSVTPIRLNVSEALSSYSLINAVDISR